MKWRHHASWRLIIALGIWLSSVPVNAVGDPGPMPDPVGDAGPPALPDNSGNPKANGQHWYSIKQWTSLGDSYATGFGVGKSLAWNRCVHFSDAYPLLMVSHSLHFQRSELAPLRALHYLFFFLK